MNKNEKHRLESLEAMIKKDRRSALGRANNAKSGRGDLSKILSSHDAQVINYMNMLERPWIAPPVRMPALLLEGGAVPVTILKVPTVDTKVTVNAAGFAYMGMSTDMWYAERIVGPTGYVGDTALTTNGVTATTPHIGDASPPTGTTGSTVQHIVLPIASDALTANSTTGTRFVNTAFGMIVTPFVGTSSNDEWTGTLTLFATTDPVRHSLLGKTTSALLTEAMVPGSAISAARYKILPDGDLEPIQSAGLVESFAGIPGQAYSSVGESALPQAVDAFKWQMINTSDTLGVTTTNVVLSCHIDGAPTQSTLTISTVRCYQIPKVASFSAENVREMHRPIPYVPMSTLQGAIANAIQSGQHVSVGAGGHKKPLSIPGAVQTIVTLAQANPSLLHAIKQGGKGLWGTLATFFKGGGRGKYPGQFAAGQGVKGYEAGHKGILGLLDNKLGALNGTTGFLGKKALGLLETELPYFLASFL